MRRLGLAFLVSLLLVTPAWAQFITGGQSSTLSNPVTPAQGGLGADFSASTGILYDAAGTFSALACTSSSTVLLGGAPPSCSSTTGITGLGTIATGVWQGTAVAGLYGGTGLSTAAVGDLLYASATTPTWSRLADVATGSVLVSGGVNTAPAYSASPTLTTSLTTPIIKGGTGTTSTLTLQPTSGAGTTNSDIIFKTGTDGATERMRLLNNGRFGVATAAPNAVMQVGTGTPLVAGTGIDIHAVNVTLASGLSTLSIYSTDAIAIDKGGTVGLGGLGAGNAYAFAILAGRSENNAYAGYFQVATVAASGTVSEWMRITSTGLVGIANNNPAKALDVTGTVNATGAYYSGGTIGCTGVPTGATLGLATTCTSDERLKTNIVAYTRGLADLVKVQPISFKWRAAEPDVIVEPEKIEPASVDKDGKPVPERVIPAKIKKDERAGFSGTDPAVQDTGFSAQNVMAAIPEAVSLTKQADGKEWYTVHDRVLLVHSINALKELAARVEKLEKVKP